MYRTLYVMALVALCTGLAHSFSWDVVTGETDQLELIHIDGTVKSTSLVSISGIQCVTYDPVHNRVLYANSDGIFSFDIVTNKTKLLIMTNETDDFLYISGLAYDPTTELLFWVEIYKNVYSILLKPEFNVSKVTEKRPILSTSQDCMLGNVYKIGIDSCGGFIYWSRYAFENGPYGAIYRSRFDGSEREVVIDNVGARILVIDQHSQKIYFTDYTDSIKNADLNGKNIRTITRSTYSILDMTVSKDFIYCVYHNNENREYSFRIIQIPKHSSRGIHLKPKLFKQIRYLTSMAPYYNIEDITQENQNCDTLKSLLPNNLVSTDNPVSLLCDHGTKVSGESRCECKQGYSGERCDVSVCHNYCLHGDCNVSAEGQPKCSCNPGFSGERCESNVCQGYCLNDGVCSLSEESKPLCRCTGHYEGERCDVPILEIKSLGRAERVFTPCILLSVYLSLNKV